MSNQLQYRRPSGYPTYQVPNFRQSNMTYAQMTTKRPSFYRHRHHHRRLQTPISRPRFNSYVGYSRPVVIPVVSPPTGSTVIPAQPASTSAQRHQYLQLLTLLLQEQAKTPVCPTQSSTIPSQCDSGSSSSQPQTPQPIQSLPPQLDLSSIAKRSHPQSRQQ